MELHGIIITQIRSAYVLSEKTDQKHADLERRISSCPLHIRAESSVGTWQKQGFSVSSLRVAA